MTTSKIVTSASMAFADQKSNMHCRLWAPHRAVEATCITTRKEIVIGVDRSMCSTEDLMLAMNGHRCAGLRTQTKRWRRNDPQFCFACFDSSLACLLCIPCLSQSNHFSSPSTLRPRRRPTTSSWRNFPHSPPNHGNRAIARLHGGTGCFPIL